MDVRGETVKDTQIREFQNCFVSLLFQDDNGEFIASDRRTPSLPTSGWQELAVDLKAPESARTGMISISLTMSGSLGVDEVALTVEGGRELPPMVVLVEESFEDVSGLPQGWSETVGATNGNGTKRSNIAVDRGSGANGSRASLRFSGDRSTIQWMVSSAASTPCPAIRSRCACRSARRTCARRACSSKTCTRASCSSTPT
jgi:hypothetical protein